MMEWWNNGFKTKELFLLKHESQVNMYLVDLNLLNPFFQYSSIPTFQMALPKGLK